MKSKKITDRIKFLKDNKTFIHNMFKFQVMFLDNKKDCELIINHEEINCDINFVNGICINEIKEYCIIGVFDNELGTLVHEATHCALFQLNRIGEQIQYDCELLPYLIENIYNECVELMNK
jgi:hypothetical protein